MHDRDKEDFTNALNCLLTEVTFPEGKESVVLTFSRPEGGTYHLYISAGIQETLFCYEADTANG